MSRCYSRWRSPIEFTGRDYSEAVLPPNAKWVVQDLDTGSNRRRQIQTVFPSPVLPGNQTLWDLTGLSKKCDILCLHLVPCMCTLIISFQKPYPTICLKIEFFLGSGGFLKPQLNMVRLPEAFLLLKDLGSMFSHFRAPERLFHRHAQAQWSKYHFTRFTDLMEFFTFEIMKHATFTCREATG